MVDPSGTFALYDFAAGWCSGVCGLLVGHPADTVKVKQQTIGNRGAITVTLSILKTEGPLGFYRGLLMPLLTAGVMNSVFFGCYGNSVRFFAFLRNEKPKRLCCENVDTNPTYRNFHYDVFFAGCLAGAVTTFGACPFELCKIKLQTQFEHLKKSKEKRLPFVKYSGSYDCLISLYKLGGLRFVYKGLVPMLWRDVPTYGLYTLAYEHTLCLCDYNSRYQTNSPFCIILGGCMAGILAWAFIMPIDVVKSRIQSDCLLDPKYQGMVDCFKKTYSDYGVKFFMRGFVVTMARAIPVNVATFGGALSWAFIMPLDVVKSRMQADSHQDPKYKGMIDCFKKTYKEGGLKIFMTGFGTTMVRALPVNAATFIGYEMFLKFYFKYVKAGV